MPVPAHAAYACQNAAGNVSAVVIGVGMLGAAISGVYVDKTKRFTSTLKLLFLIGTLASIAVRPCASGPTPSPQPQFVFALQYGSYTIIMCCSAFLGAPLPITPALTPPGLAAFAILPVALELSVECTYPVNEGTSAGFLWVAVQLLSIGVVSVMGALEGSRGAAAIPMIPAHLFAHVCLHLMDYRLR